jgi:ankyrin repeat protein
MVCPQNGVTALHLAATTNSTEFVSYMIDNGAGLMERTEDGDTPLHWAAKTNSLDSSSMLLANGADIDAINEVL